MIPSENDVQYARRLQEETTPGDEHGRLLQAGNDATGGGDALPPVSSSGIIMTHSSYNSQNNSQKI